MAAELGLVEPPPHTELFGEPSSYHVTTPAQLGLVDALLD